MDKEITESGMMSLISAIFQVACSDYTVAYYNTHFDFQEYVDQRALYENRNLEKRTNTLIANYFEWQIPESLK